MARKDMAIAWAESAHGDAFEQIGRAARDARLRLAIVAPEEYIDRDLIGLKIAAIHGLTACIVTTEQAAIAWMKVVNRQSTSP